MHINACSIHTLLYIKVRLLLLLYNNNISIRVAWLIAEYAYKHNWDFTVFAFHSSAFSTLIQNRKKEKKWKKWRGKIHTNNIKNYYRKQKPSIFTRCIMLFRSFSLLRCWWSLHTVVNSNKNDAFVHWLAISNWLQSRWGTKITNIDCTRRNQRNS